jgi:hypothetical protein
MLEARLTKAVIIQDDKTGGTVLMAVAEYYGDMVNIKVPFNWETLDRAGFCDDLREKLAMDFDIPSYRVDIQAAKLLGKMEEYHYYLKGTQ